MSEFQNLTGKNIKIESGVTTREQFEKICEELQMLPDTNMFFEDRTKKYLQCNVCGKVTLFYKKEGEWQCQDCYK